MRDKFITQSLKINKLKFIQGSQAVKNSTRFEDEGGGIVFSQFKKNVTLRRHNMHLPKM